jgi:hypothetical protein
VIALAQPKLSQSLSPNPADFKNYYLRDTTKPQTEKPPDMEVFNGVFRI